MILIILTISTLIDDGGLAFLFGAGMARTPPWSDRHVAFVAFGAALGAREGILFSLLLILMFLLDYWITGIPNGREPRRQGYRRALARAPGQ